MKHLFISLALCSLTALQAQEKDTLSTEELPQPKSERTDLRIDNTLARVWELEPQYQQGTFRFTNYRPMYAMPFRYTDVPTEQPVSLNPERPVPEWRDYQHVEMKFQVSLKGKIIQDALFGKEDLWVAFTQQAYWQMYNGEISRPFREINYEPELMFTYPMKLSIGNLKLRMLGLSVNHQSNGKEAAHSRSWNRLILMGAMEYRSVGIGFRFWKRFYEKEKEDDNPHIQDYIGRCEFNIFIPFKKNVFSIRLLDNLRFDHNRGLAEVAWVYPLNRDLRILFQASHGYGDSLIDYNYKQTVLGVGLTFLSL